MKKSIFAVAIMGITAAFSGCKKEELNAYVISDVQYEVTDINNCSFSNGGDNGSSITFSLKTDNPNFDDVYGISYQVDLNSDEDENFVTRDLDLYFTGDELVIYRCVRFGQKSEANYSFRIVTFDGLRSEEFKVKVPRPAGAN